MYRVGQTIGNITLIDHRTVKKRLDVTISGGWQNGKRTRKINRYRIEWLCSDGTMTKWIRLDSKHIGSHLNVRRHTPLTKRERRQLEVFEKNGFTYRIFQPFVCVDCGERFEALINPVWSDSHRRCSECRQASKRGANLRRRCKKFKVTYTSKLSAISILERDNWICQICGELAPKELRGTTDPLAPEVDHIVPLHWGPELSPGHVESNCRCTHRKCNSEKSNPSGRYFRTHKSSLFIQPSFIRWLVAA